MNEQNKNPAVFGEDVKRLPLSQMVKRIGPGLIATGIVIGPGAVTTASMLHCMQAAKRFPTVKIGLRCQMESE